MYEIQITRGGVNMSHDQAAEFVVNGFRVTVMAVSGPHDTPSNIWAELKAGSGTDARSRTFVNFAPLRALEGPDAAAVASVAVVASEVAAAADRLLAAHDAANA